MKHEISLIYRCLNDGDTKGCSFYAKKLDNYCEQIKCVLFDKDKEPPYNDICHACDHFYDNYDCYFLQNGACTNLYAIKHAIHEANNLIDKQIGSFKNAK